MRFYSPKNAGGNFNPAAREANREMYDMNKNERNCYPRLTCDTYRDVQMKIKIKTDNVEICQCPHILRNTQNR